MGRLKPAFCSSRLRGAMLMPPLIRGIGGKCGALEIVLTKLVTLSSRNSRRCSWLKIESL